MTSLKASQQGLAQIRQAITQKGWKMGDGRWLMEASKLHEPQADWHESGPYAYGCSLQTWERFLKGSAIREYSFIAFCQVLGVRPEEVAESSHQFRGNWGNIHRIPRTGRGYKEPLIEITNALPLQMVLVPGGTFMMGSPDDESERFDNESPQHEVTVPTFFMGRYPITQAQWRAVVALPQVNRELETNPSRFRGDDHPVEHVSWDDAVEFCDRLAQHTNRPYRLPSEAEWEYACRAGTKTPFSCGNTLPPEVASPEVARFDGRTTPVNYSGVANAFGLSDMHGNAWQWCQDYWHDNYEGAPVDGSAWLTGGNEQERVYRGGACNTGHSSCRSASRAYIFNNLSDPIYNGLRVVCSAPRALQ